MAHKPTPLLKTPRAKRVAISQITFHKLCEMLRTHREEINRTCHSRNDVMTFLIGKVGMPFATNALDNALKATEITLDCLQVRRSASAAESVESRRTVLNAVISLYEALRLPISTDMRELYQREYGLPYREPLPMPSTTGMPKTISVPHQSNIMAGQ